MAEDVDLAKKNTDDLRTLALRSDMPFQRNNPNTPLQDNQLHIETMLIEEYRYAAQVATQALTDRDHVVEQYLLVFGAAVVAAIAAVYQLSQVGAQDSIPAVLLGFFLAVGVLGTGVFISLARRRAAFNDSQLTMTVIKEFYIQKFKEDVPSVTHAFRWRLTGIPHRDRIGSISFLYSYTVAFLSASCLAGAAIVSYLLVRTAMAGHTDFLYAAPEYVVGAVTFTGLLLLYLRAYRSQMKRS